MILVNFREMETLDLVFKAICRHIEFSTNKGNIRPAITVFPPRPRDGSSKDKIRVWNTQLIQFAGYALGDGAILGDRGNLKFTKVCSFNLNSTRTFNNIFFKFCQRLGWDKENKTAFDVLPIILSDSTGCPKFFEIPEEIVMRVKIMHPE